jgi:hypothetical protein
MTTAADTQKLIERHQRYPWGNRFEVDWANTLDGFPPDPAR